MLRAHEDELSMRPPTEEFLAAYFRYKRPHLEGEDQPVAPEPALVSVLPEYEE